MQIITDLFPLDFPKEHCGLTIGNFDGVHRGHLFLLNHLRTLLPQTAPLIVYTFTDHPTHILSPHSPTASLYTLDHKLKILRENQVDYTILTPFTQKIAQIPYDAFLTELKEKLGFTTLVLGQGARFGKDKQGTQERVCTIAKKLDFHVEYLPKLQINAATVSSSQIRTLISQGQFSEVSSYLGRPYSLYAPLRLEQTHYSLPIPLLSLPPQGSYLVRIVYNAETYPAQLHIDREVGQIPITFIEDKPQLYADAFAEVYFMEKIR